MSSHMRRLATAVSGSRKAVPAAPCASVCLRRGDGAGGRSRPAGSRPAAVRAPNESAGSDTSAGPVAPTATMPISPRTSMCAAVRASRSSTGRRSVTTTPAGQSRRLPVRPHTELERTSAGCCSHAWRLAVRGQQQDLRWSGHSLRIPPRAVLSCRCLQRSASVRIVCPPAT